MKKLILYTLLLLAFSLHAGRVIWAAPANNKFGIHLAQPDTGAIRDAAKLVNSSGGDWGYITLVMQENDRDKGKWQDVFNELRRDHLIPIIRIATDPDGSAWLVPTADSAGSWADFLDSLNWVVKNRYVILFNEPNHGGEWGGRVDPVSYKNVALQFAKKLKAKNPDFFIMLAGLDASAPSARPAYEDEEVFLSQVFSGDSVKEWNELLSGWSSHSYPNPGFAGSPYGVGRGSVRNYQWELNLLSRYGIKDMPVFITETGWDAAKVTRIGIANSFEQAFSSVWLPDDQIKAVTPFILDYQTEPFMNFSWKMPGSGDFYQQYTTVRDMAKVAGQPEIIDRGTLSYDLPTELVVNSSYQFKVGLKNSGQAYWDNKFTYFLDAPGLNAGSQEKTYLFSDIVNVNPSDTEELDLYLKTGNTPQNYSTQLRLMHGNREIVSGPKWNFEVVPLPSLAFNVSLFPRLKHKGNDFEIQIFDEKEKLVYKKKNVAVEHTRGAVTDIQNIALGRPYRLVILKPYYLPRQTHINFKKNGNRAVFDRMLPLDFNLDGALSFKDVWALITHPKFLSLFLP